MEIKLPNNKLIKIARKRTPEEQRVHMGGIYGMHAGGLAGAGLGYLTGKAIHPKAVGPATLAGLGAGIISGEIIGRKRAIKKVEVQRRKRRYASLVRNKIR